MQNNKKIQGNRCGHNPRSLRFCDHALRSKKIAKANNKKLTHPVLQHVSAMVNRAAWNRSQLKDWHNLNTHRRRSEIREAMAAVVQFLLVKYYQLESQACGKLSEDGNTLIAPNIRQMASQINNSKEWKFREGEISQWRIRTILKEFETVGYIKRSPQRAFQHQDGRWESGPKLIKFTNRFFIQLGGAALWDKVMKAKCQRLDPIIKKIKEANPFQSNKQLNKALARYFEPRYIRTLYQFKSDPDPTAIQHGITSQLVG